MRRTAMILMSFCLLAGLTMPACLAKTSPIAVIKSAFNGSAYENQHLGTFEDDYQEFKRTLMAANVQFDELGDADLSAGKLSTYKLVVTPLVVDMSPEAVAALTQYKTSGGKLIITDGGGQPGSGALSVCGLAGVQVQRQMTLKDPGKLVWTDSPIPIADSVAVGTMVASLGATAAEAKTLAKWRDTSGTDIGIAIMRNANIAFLGWAPGVQGDIMVNSRYLSMVLDELAPGITQEAATQISFAEYQTIKSELEYLTKRTEETIKTAKQAEFAVASEVIQQDQDKAVKLVEEFHEAYKSRRFLEADEKLNKARELFALAFAQAMPVRPVEARSVWLDRGTIVAAKSPQGMAALFDKLKAAGINVVYFETNNAGFTMYPSQLTEQNPETIGWDPLGAGIKEARKRGMEIHAWMWIFAVGNTRHNPIINKSEDYQGPVLSKYDANWAMTTATGTLVPKNQHEFWLDPSNPECRQYIKSLISEVISKYDVDGVQLDYIRYPFNNKGSECGFNWLSRTKFEQETGLSLDKLDDETRNIFVVWKSHQVNQLVKEVSEMVRAKNPKLRISAAVYAFPRRMRLNAIQQEWETWVVNGWIDTLNPMTYANTTQNLSLMSSFCRESTGDKALVYPGLAIRRVDNAGLIEQMDTARETGTLGTTFFAAAHLDDSKLNMLKVGPYRRQTLLTPQSQPIRASRFLMDDFAAMVNRYLQDPRKHILADTASTNDVLSQIDTLQRKMRELTNNTSSNELDLVIDDVEHLHDTVKQWLRLEAFIQRGFRAQYIVNYLSQVEAILSYASHRAMIHDRDKASGVAGSSSSDVQHSSTGRGGNLRLNIQEGTNERAKGKSSRKAMAEDDSMRDGFNFN